MGDLWCRRIRGVGLVVVRILRESGRNHLRKLRPHGPGQSAGTARSGPMGRWAPGVFGAGGERCEHWRVGVVGTGVVSVSAQRSVGSAVV